MYRNRIVFVENLIVQKEPFCHPRVLESKINEINEIKTIDFVSATTYPLDSFFLWWDVICPLTPCSSIHIDFLCNL